MPDRPGLPAGTVTFLFTDLEGSTRLLQAHPATYRDAVRRHHALLRGAVEAHGGAVFETVGDAVYAAFERPTDAVAAALEGHLALQREEWGETGPLRARMGLHTGEVEREGGHYFGAPLYRCARLMGTAHGGQVVLSEVTAGLVRDALAAGTGLRDLGEHQLKDLQRPERVAQLLHPDLPGEFPPLRTLDARPHNLPLQLTSFVGRERELGEVAALLGTTRLLTLTGPGGTGKTRLALQAAADAVEAYPDGVWLAELAALADPALVPQAVAAAVGVREEPGRPLATTLAEALRPKRLLLVLDNCEHLLEACARLADALLRACPHVRLLATSREALGIAGETARRVPSLGVPKAAGVQPAPGPADLHCYAAVRLFCDRAAAARPGFALTAESAAAVAQVCARLDGIPLALELAAARVRVLPPKQLLARLEDRFGLLTGGSRTAPARHQTLRAAVDWSYDLLTEQERRLFARLAVFAGSWTLDAAEAVGADADGPEGGGVGPGEVLDLLTRLVDTSLVVAEVQPDGTARYRLLETLRQYGRERSAAGGEAAAVSQRHAGYFLALAERAEPELRGAGQVPWMGVLVAEHDNLRAALQWSLGADPALGLRLAGALGHFWRQRGYHREGRRWLEAALAAAGADPAPGPDATGSALGRALDAVGRLASDQGDPGAARAAFEASLTRYRAAGDRSGMAAALRLLGYHLVDDDRARALRLWDESERLAREDGDARAVSVVLGYRGLLAAREGELDRARALAAAALALRRQVGDTWLMARSHEDLGAIAFASGDRQRAGRHWDEALRLGRDVGDRRVVGSVLLHLARRARAAGDGRRARVLLGESIRHFLAMGTALVYPALMFLGVLLSEAGDPARGVRLQTVAAGRVRGDLIWFWLGAEARDWEARLVGARAALDADGFAAASAAGRALPLEQAVADALAEDGGDG